MNTDHRHIEVQYAISSAGLPPAEDVRHWAEIALQEHSDAAELVVRIVDEAEITALNQRYRGKSGATNVLSFPCEPIAGVATALLGDVVVCAPVVAAEARTQAKPLEAHWAHLVIHGVLHLLGHDHKHETGARIMESLETVLLARLGYADPYQVRDH